MGTDGWEGKRRDYNVRKSHGNTFRQKGGNSSHVYVECEKKTQNVIIECAQLVRGEGFVQSVRCVFRIMDGFYGRLYVHWRLLHVPQVFKKHA